MASEGVTIHRPALKPFQDAAAPVVERFAKDEVADFVKKIRQP